MNHINFNKRLEGLEDKHTPKVTKPFYFMVEGQDPYPEDPSKYQGVIVYQVIDSREDFERLNLDPKTTGEK